jgi:protein-disulfide isomerase
LTIHANAFRAAEAASCVGAQGKFWQMHDLLFDPPQALDADGLLASAKATGSDMQKFSACMKDQEMRSAVRESAKFAQSLGITSTPSLAVGLVQSDGRVAVKSIRSSMAAPELATVLDSYLKQFPQR